MFTLTVNPLELVVRTAIIYAAFLVALRLFGKREVGQFTIYDLALILLAANALQPAMTGPDESVLGAFIIIGTIFAMNWAVALAAERIPAFRDLVRFRPRVLAVDGRWDQGAVTREGLSDDELQTALREHGVDHVEQTREVVMEPDGEISVVTSDWSYRRRRRHARSRI
jgi:uncharacterized membrane protein YcaP (DUF421 family)